MIVGVDRKEHHQKWREENRERYRELVRRAQAKYKKTPKGKKTEHKYKTSEKNKEYNRKYRERNPHMMKCYMKAALARRGGKLIPKPCGVCGNRTVHAHHDDYNKPLEVRWLCPRHHSQLHNQKYPEVKNNGFNRRRKDKHLERV